MVRTSAPADLARRKSFAAKPDEPVASFALISSIMPRGVGQRPQTYRIALTIGLVVALIAAIFGAMPIAVLVAAFAIPIVYIVYIYDVNLWEDEPIPVTGLAFALTGVLTIGFTILWTYLRGPVPFGTTTYDGSLSATPSVGAFLLVALVVPIVGEAIRQVGPVVLASRPEFDDLMDGLTFGVISGVAYACFDTLVRHWEPADRRPAGPGPRPVGVADLPRGVRQAADLRHRDRHRLRGVLRSGPRASTGSRRATSAGWPRPCWPTSPTRPAPTCSRSSAARPSASSSASSGACSSSAS